MTFRVVSNKKVDMTDEEYNEYVKICRSYDRQFFKGEDLFKDLFETNDDGMIIYIKSLGNKQFTFEVVFFVMNLMQNQWLRLMTRKVNELIVISNKRIDDKIAILDKKIEDLNKQSK